MTETDSQETSQAFSHLRGLQRPFYLEANGSNQNNKCFDVRVLISTLHSCQPSGWSWSRACARKPQALIGRTPNKPQTYQRGTHGYPSYLSVCCLESHRPLCCRDSEFGGNGREACCPTHRRCPGPSRRLARFLTPSRSNARSERSPTTNSASSQSTLPQSANRLLLIFSPTLASKTAAIRLLQLLPDGQATPGIPQARSSHGTIYKLILATRASKSS